MKFLAYDSPLMIWARKATDYMLLGLLWFFTSLPIVTYGAATSAALLTAEKSLRQEGGKVWRTFFDRFRREFKQATCLWLIQLPVTAVLVVNIWLISVNDLADGLEVVIAAASLLVFCWTKLWLAYQSTFTDPIKVILRNSLAMTFGRFLPVLGMGLLELACIGATAALFLTMAPMMVLIPGIQLFLYGALARKVFKKFLDTPAETVESREDAK